MSWSNNYWQGPFYMPPPRPPTPPPGPGYILYYPGGRSAPYRPPAALNANNPSNSSGGNQYQYAPAVPYLSSSSNGNPPYQYAPLPPPNLLSSYGNPAANSGAQYQPYLQPAAPYPNQSSSSGNPGFTGSRRHTGALAYMPSMPPSLNGVAVAQPSRALPQPTPVPSVPISNPMRDVGAYPQLVRVSKSNPAAQNNTATTPKPAPAPVFAPLPPVTPTPLAPPNWQQIYQDTIISTLPYKTFPIEYTSLEYQTILELLHPIPVVSAEKIVNPDLWQRYANTRKDMLRAKSDNLDLLSKLGLDEMEVMRSAHVSVNFNKDPLLKTESGAYSPNEVLLFHCTRNKANLIKILSHGLDERLGSTTGGLLGRGIYFADDPQKSIQYDSDGTGVILIFSVLLGDCLGVDHNRDSYLFVREPEKHPEQRRNFNDSFFDSITARPKAHNEYVIYNRFQCCPLYQIKYQWGGVGGHGNGNGNTSSSYSMARLCTPTVAWRTVPGGTNCSMPNQCVDGNWPFFAVNLFEKMGVQPPAPANDDNDEEEEDEEEDDDDWIQQCIQANMEADTNEKLAALIYLGFFDESKNRETLESCNNNLDVAVNVLLDGAVHPITGSQQDPTTSGSSNSRASKKTSKSATATIAVPPKEDCSICCYEYDAFTHSPFLWKQLRCMHKLCLNCFQSMETNGTTMSGIQHTSIKCPFCLQITGTEVGSCPDGEMTVKSVCTDCEGYPGVASWQINYYIDSGNYHLNRMAYLPNTKKGNQVLKLLKEAWDRRLIFGIGTSVTTGEQDALVWNIHHKTALNGGVQSHGYPDPGYLERVKGELKAYGIE